MEINDFINLFTGIAFCTISIIIMIKVTNIWSVEYKKTQHEERQKLIAETRKVYALIQNIEKARL